MSQSVEPMREKNPKDAEFVEQWQSNFERDYDFSKQEEQANFVEALQTMASFLANRNKNATVRLSLGSDGVTALSSQTSPKVDA